MLFIEGTPREIRADSDLLWLLLRGGLGRWLPKVRIGGFLKWGP
jgi:hypothetical protein